MDYQNKSPTNIYSSFASEKFLQESNDDPVERFIANDKYTIFFNEELGFGAYGNVYKGKQNDTGKVVAIKSVPIKYFDSTLKQEAEIQLELKNPHIVELFDVVVAKTQVYLIMEYCNSGSLFSYLKKMGKLPETAVKTIARQLAIAFRELEKRKIMHRDLKPENILLNIEQNNDVIVKLADFGLARFLNPGSCAKTQAGTLDFMAPEVYKGEDYNSKADLWSIGIMLYEMLTGKMPFSNKIPQVETDFSLPSSLSIELILMLKGLLQVNPELRMGWKEFFNTPFISEKTRISIVFEGRSAKTQTTYILPRRETSTSNRYESPSPEKPSTFTSSTAIFKLVKKKSKNKKVKREESKLNGSIEHSPKLIVEEALKEKKFTLSSGTLKKTSKITRNSDGGKRNQRKKNAEFSIPSEFRSEKENIHYFKDNTFNLVMFNCKKNAGIKVKIGISRKKIPFDFCSLHISQRLFYCGGYFNYESPKTVCSLWEFKFESSFAERKKNMLSKVSLHELVHITPTKFQSIGGWNEKEGELQTCQIYDMEKDEWTFSKPISEPKSGVTAVNFSEKYIYIFGGCKENTYSLLIERQCIAKIENGWKIIQLHSKKNWEGRSIAGACQISSSEILIYGGSDEKGMKNETFKFNVFNTIEEVPAKLIEVDSFSKRKGTLFEGEVFSYGRSQNIHIFSLSQKTWSKKSTNSS